MSALLELAALVAGGVTTYAIARRARSRPPPAAERCVGYLADEKFESRSSGGHLTRAEMRDDCNALRSPGCLDGRCSYHCNAMCRCCVPDHPTTRGTP